MHHHPPHHGHIFVYIQHCYLFSWLMFSGRSYSFSIQACLTLLLSLSQRAFILCHINLGSCFSCLNIWHSKSALNLFTFNFYKAQTPTRTLGQAQTLRHRPSTKSVESMKNTIFGGTLVWLFLTLVWRSWHLLDFSDTCCTNVIKCQTLTCVGQRDTPTCRGICAS